MSQRNGTGVYRAQWQLEQKARFQLARCFADLLAFLICPYVAEDNTLVYKRFYVATDNLRVLQQGHSLKVPKHLYGGTDIERLVYDENLGHLVLARSSAGNLEVRFRLA